MTSVVGFGRRGLKLVDLIKQGFNGKVQTLNHFIPAEATISTTIAVLVFNMNDAFETINIKTLFIYKFKYYK